MLSLVACQQESPHRFIEEDLPYFDLRGLTDTLAVTLQEDNPKVRKRVVQRDSTEVQTIRIADWEQELTLFREADINKPVLRDSYTTEQRGDTLVHRANTEEPAVRHMRVIRNEEGTRIRISFRERSRLFDVERELALQLSPARELQRYRIDSRQDITLKESQRYLIEGKIQ